MTANYPAGAFAHPRAPWNEPDRADHWQVCTECEGFGVIYAEDWFLRWDDRAFLDAFPTSWGIERCAGCGGAGGFAYPCPGHCPEHCTCRLCAFS